MNLRLSFFIIVLIGIIAGVTFLTADEVPGPDIKDPALGDSDLRFIKNQGQWENMIEYLVPLNGGKIFLEKDRLTYYFFEQPLEGHGLPPLKQRPPEEQLFKSHTFRVHFKGANSNPNIEPGLKYPEHHNYYLGNDQSKWAEKVPLHGLIHYREIYPKTDLRIYGIGDAVKYDFILKPGGDPDDITLEFEGADKVFLKKGQLHIHTSLRDMIELPPFAYQNINGRKKEVACEFKLKKNRLTYHFPKGYDADYELVIDPTLIFSTYTGATSDNWGFTATYDDDGNAYAGGIIQTGTNNNGYPTVTGAYQTTFQGGQSDVTLSKFNASGSALLFSTYVGGLQAEQPHSLIANDQGELFVYGRTNSSNFPTTNGAHDNNFNGQYDIFIARISTTGGLLASTFVGGNQDDGVNGDPDFSTFVIPKVNYGDDARGEIILDDQGNPIIAAQTKSDNFPVPGNAYRNFNAGGQDGVIFKMDANLSNITWATYLGGTGEDAAYALKLDNQENVYVAGGTTSSNFPTNTNTTNYQGGITDGFVTKLNSTGTAMINSTYLGTSDYDQAYLLELDKDFNVYICGQTRGTYPVLPGPTGLIYSNTNAKQFITKLTNDLSTPLLSTVFGSTGSANPNISPTAMLVDRCGNIYVSGWGGSTNSNAGGNVSGMPLTADALDSSPGADNSDFYMIVLSRDAQTLVYGSYMGGYVNGSAGDHVDGGTSRFDKNGVVYHAVCAGCWGNSSFPAQPSSVWSTTNGSSSCNLAIFKMDFDLSGIEADFQPLDTNNVPITQTQGCAPLTVNFDNTSFVGVNPGPVSYLWNFDDNGASSSQFEPTYIFQSAGTYNVMLIITDSTSCNISDTTFRTVVVFPPPSVDAGPDASVCAGDTITLAALTTGSTYQWSGNGIISTTNTNQVSVVGINTGLIYLTITDTQGCSATDSVLLTVDNSFNVQARDDTVICRGGNFQLRANSNGGVSYEWTAIPTANISNSNIQNPTVTNLDTTTMFYVRSVNALGCEDLDSVEVEVFEVFTLEDTFVCDGNSILLASSNGISWTWEPNDGSLDNNTIASPTATPLVNTTYTVTAISANGCISVKDVLVEVRANPVAEAGPDQEMCFGSSVNLQAQGGLTYQWTPTNGLSNSQIANPVAAPSSTTTYFVTVSNSSGCEDTDSMTVVVHPLPSVTVNEDETICEGESINLLATGAVTYTWSPAGSLTNASISNPIANPSSTTLYSVIGTDVNGCQNTDSVLITVIPKPITEIDGINQICIGGSIVLTASGGDSYIWSTGETTAEISIIPDQPTTYYATAYIGQCEGIPDSITVDVFFDYPAANFTIEPGPGFSPRIVTFNNLTTGAASYEWDFGFGVNNNEESPVHPYPVAGEYTITLIAYSAQGCPDTASQTILLENVALHAPSGFTPNADGTNDFFQVGYYGIETLNVRIYSRWGEKIYESNNKDFRWDGRYKGTAVPEGVYVFVIEGIGENGLNYERKGTVTVIR